jgi:hypothetical protein
MNCPACHKEISSDAGACPSCGFSFDDATRLLDYPASSLAGPGKAPRRPSNSFDSIDDARFVPGTILAERYRIVGLLGKGGMGEVYRADDLKLGQPVALKFLSAELVSDSEALARLYREVRIARQVSHPNVCRVYDIGELDGHHFLSMEFIKGEELSSLLRRIGRLPADKATEIARQICAGLAAAHNRGVLHRDLKPANVMIDEHGNARLTDFGIAALAEEIRGEEIRAGTPSYMSPEQLAGKQLTTKSDIYSLGLVLYELFTGKKAFDAPTIPQLLNLRHSDSTPTNPSTLVKNIDPLVERAILRCLEKDPEKRPESALQVAALLPGGDPLAAALAAGETPSPEMVAAAPKEGVLRLAVAGILLASAVLAIAAVVLLSERTELHRQVALEKSPEALKERARTVAARLGYTNPPADSTYGLDIDNDYLRYVEEKNPALLHQLSSQPAAIYFWYRQSPRYLLPRIRLGVRATEVDPPETLSGMISVCLDPLGRLIEFHAVPPQVDELEQTPVSPNWSALFEEAGLNQASFTPAPSKWVPPVNSDSRAAWEGTLANQSQTTIRVEAAAYRGKPVYFRLIGPWNSPASGQQGPSSLAGKIITFVLVAAVLAIMFIGVFLGRRNLRNGSGDRRGGTKLAIYIFVALMVSWVFRAHHYGANDELSLFLTGIQFALLPTVLLWLFYLALEPYVRRWWPHRMVSWSRLLAGDFRDPLIGRDLLIGSVFGMAIVIAAHIRVLASGWLGRAQTIQPVRLHTLLGLRELLGDLFFTGVTLCVFLGVTYLFILLLLHIVFRRRERIAIAFAWLLFTVLAAIDGHFLPALDLLYAGLVSALLIAAATQFGLLTLTAALFFSSLFSNYPMTTDFSTWYAPSTILALTTGLVLVGYGFYVSLAGRALFGGKLLED